jgi:hypothetical protein
MHAQAARREYANPYHVHVGQVLTSSEGGRSCHWRVMPCDEVVLGDRTYNYQLVEIVGPKRSRYSFEFADIGLQCAHQHIPAGGLPDMV